MRRSVTLSIAPATVAAVLCLAMVAGPVAAATRNVTMNDGQAFSPSYVSISRGDSARWKNNATFEEHDVFSTGPAKYFKSGPAGGMGPGDRYSKTFPSAGSFAYLCRVHAGMDGTVIVPMSARRITAEGTVKFKLTVASAALSTGSPYRHVVWVDTPNGGWQILKTTTKSNLTYIPSASGTYYFRSEVTRLSDGSSSGFSPVSSVTT